MGQMLFKKNFIILALLLFINNFVSFCYCDVDDTDFEPDKNINQIRKREINSIKSYLNTLYQKRSVENSLSLDTDIPLPHKVVSNIDENDFNTKFITKRFDEIRDDDNRDNDSDDEHAKVHKKRLETIDGVEIASSYREYIDLASGDIDDRLSKTNTKLNDLRDRIKKRTELSDEIEKEIVRRRTYSQELSEKDKMLRNRLIRNTEMKSALVNLADIAGYKLDTNKLIQSQENKQQSSDATNENLNILSNLQVNKNSIADTLLNNPSGSVAPPSLLKGNGNNSTYTRYIEMAYSEVQSILTTDKQTLIDVIRKIKDNDEKSSELERLKRRVTNSLKRLRNVETSVDIVLKHYQDISGILHRLKTIIKQYQNHNLLKKDDSRPTATNSSINEIADSAAVKSLKNEIEDGLANQTGQTANQKQASNPNAN